MTTKKNTTPLEDWEAEQFHQWLATRNIPHTHIPNETGHSQEAKRRAAKMKRQGTSAGVYDYEIYIPLYGATGEVLDYELVKLELKRTKGGSVSDSQRKWGKIYTTAGIRNFVCKGHQEAIATVQTVMEEIGWRNDSNELPY